MPRNANPSCPPRRFSSACFFLSAIAASVFAAGRAPADSCLADLWSDGLQDSSYVFPNWRMVPMGSFTAMFYDANPGTENIKGITVVNFGTADPSDIKAVYARVYCNTANTGLLTLNYAGTFTEDSGSYPAWTWAGTSADFSGCAELWTPGPGGFTIDLYADIDDCPSAQRTVMLGFTTNKTNNTTWWGSVSDSQTCAAPWGDVTGPQMTIVYAYKKSDLDTVAPGDTINYTIYYGRPGNTALSRIIILDTQPAYTHFVPSSAVPATDPGWDPNPGPPPKAKWTINGPIAILAGPTNEVRFAISVDWGNGEAFEPGSGNTAAPEGYRLRNQACYEAVGSSCPSQTSISNAVDTVVRRYLFWKIADQDLLFATGLGTPNDEITYEIFVRNLSSDKTWWNVSIWDTVPTALDAWAVGCGFDDPCAGWTMTPSGCAAASPGSQVSGPTTTLTWRMDMPPMATISLRWKAAIKPSTPDGATALNKASLLALGRTRIVGGTGHAGEARNFTHLAPVILRTTYTSYVGYAASGADEEACPYGFYVHFFPPNKATNFELRKLEYQGPGNCTVPAGNWASDGGISASIGTFAGTCIGGFPEGGSPGCKAERVPATYWPDQWVGVCPSWPFHFIYKVVSNSPMAWEFLRQIHNTEDNGSMFTPSTSNSFSGYTHYTYLRQLAGSKAAGYGDELYIVNTDPILATTVHIFKWNSATLSYEYRLTGEVDTESEWMPFVGTPDGEEGYYKIISSDGKLIIWQSVENNGSISCLCYSGISNICPTRETGYFASQPGSGATFYAFCRHNDTETNLSVGNLGAAAATYELHRYVPAVQTLTAGIPPTLSGTSGKWIPISTDTVASGMAPPNPHIYGCAPYDTGKIVTSQPYLSLYRVTQKSGGGLQVMAGNWLDYRGAAGVIHDKSGASQAGTEFWYHQTTNTTHSECSWHTGCDDTKLFVIDLFCPKAGTSVRMVSNDGYSAAYTTTGSDQCIAFRRMTNLGPCGARRNYRINVLTASNVIAIENHCSFHEKMLVAPFMAMGTHYVIIAPPVVFIGQSFWITIVVVDTGGSTETNYSGTSSFTSTDPGAKIQGTGMESYNYVWTGCGSDCGVRIFVNVSFSKSGMQTLVASDTMDGSINGLTSILVVAADIKIEKRRRLTVAASGDTVQFQICWSNYSSATGFSFTITDAVPMGTSYVPEVASTMTCGTSAPLPGVTVYYSTATTTTPPGTFTSVPGTGSPLGNTRWLRWAVRDVYVNSSGCVCFRVSVN